MCRQSINFQRALRFKTVAFSRDIQSPELPESKPTPLPPVEVSLGGIRAVVVDNRNLPPATSSSRIKGCKGCGGKNGAFEKLVITRPDLDAFRLVHTPNKRAPFQENKWGGEEERPETESPVRVSGPVREGTSYAPGPCGAVARGVFLTPSVALASMPTPAEEFDSSDMVMVARLLAHPESSLKVRTMVERDDIEHFTMCRVEGGQNFARVPVLWYVTRGSMEASDCMVKSPTAGLA